MGLCGAQLGSVGLIRALWGSVGLCVAQQGSVGLCGARQGSVGFSDLFCGCQAAERHVAGTWVADRLNSRNTNGTG